jgi:NAD(P)-dependent dehydrogenase (short-subunit alcohol dehydrogenase family)
LKKEKRPYVLASLAREATREACSAIRALTTGDDPREPASGAFAHARALAKAGAATALCAALAREAEAGDHVDLRLAQQLAAATRHVAVNDDICRETAERGGLTTTLRLLRGPVTGSARATKACAQLVRQLAGSDHVKGLILKHDGIAALAHCARVFAERAATAQAPTPKENGDANVALSPVLRSMLESGSKAGLPKSIQEKFQEKFLTIV